MVKNVQACNFLVYSFSLGKLPSELQLLKEDPSEYQDPEEGNVVYKLFSLNELLLLVRCSVHKVRSLPLAPQKRKAQKVKILFSAFFGWFVWFFLNTCAQLAFLGFPVLDSICALLRQL